VIFASLWAVFTVLTPRRFRVTRAPIWPGAAVVTLVWGAATSLMPRLLGYVGGYTLTYGSLAGVIIAMLFFYAVGLALVVGANLNAALAKARESQLKALAAKLR
jgi:membrane protein